ncbi:MAG: HEAT repeat domain-containing protein, partial [Roseibacillus sp.]|nr:HEAT repeat domain-containing protein [Roseibacillus sp.]
GPDGALYVADWYNPIIGHYQASLRHPDRDKKHGRIWRITAKGKKTVKQPQYDELPTRNLLDALKTAPLKERERLRMILSNRYHDPEIAGRLEEELAAWVSTLDPDDPRFEHHLFEALCLYEWFEVVNVSLLNQLLGAREPLARAYATRVVGRWHDRLQEPLRSLEKSVTDPHPRVRLEAVVAAGQFQSAEAMAVATRVLEAPTDRFLEAALRQCAHALQPRWFAALQEGKLAISDAGQLAFLLKQTTGQDAAGIARTMLEDQTSDRSSPTFATLAKLLATQGTIEDLEWLVTLAYKFRENATPALAALVESARLRNLKPRTSVLPLLLVFAVESGTTGQRMHALQLIGHWNLRDLGDRVIQASLNPRFEPEVRIAAVEAMSRLPEMGKPRLNALSRLLDEAEEIGLRHAALDTLTG